MKHIKSRIISVGYFFEGRINLLELFLMMLPASMRTENLHAKPPLNPFGYSGEKLTEYQVVTMNQYHVELIKDNDNVVDAGANVGIFSIFVAQKHPNTIIYAFEPEPSVFEKLKESTKDYSNIKCFNFALGEKNGTSFIEESGESGEGSHVGKNGKPCEVKTIDSLGIHVDFLKMDTEGYEAPILKGAKETIKRYKPIVAMSSYHKPNDEKVLPKILNHIIPYNCELHYDCEKDLICTPI